MHGAVGGTSSRTRIGAALLLINLLGAIAYVWAASRGGWVMPEDRAAGIDSVTGEPFVWFIAIAPIIATFLLLNVSWGAWILTRRQWMNGRYWLLSLPLWWIAIWTDFAHH